MYKHCIHHCQLITHNLFDTLLLYTNTCCAGRRAWFFLKNWRVLTWLQNGWLRFHCPHICTHTRSHTPSNLEPGNPNLDPEHSCPSKKKATTVKSANGRKRTFFWFDGNLPPLGVSIGQKLSRILLYIRHGRQSLWTAPWKCCATKSCTFSRNPAQPFLWRRWLFYEEIYLRQRSGSPSLPGLSVERKKSSTLSYCSGWLVEEKEDRCL